MVFSVAISVKRAYGEAGLSLKMSSSVDLTGDRSEMTTDCLILVRLTDFWLGIAGYFLAL